MVKNMHTSRWRTGTLSTILNMQNKLELKIK